MRDKSISKVTRDKLLTRGKQGMEKLKEVSRHVEDISRRRLTSDNHSAEALSISIEKGHASIGASGSAAVES